MKRRPTQRRKNAAAALGIGIGLILASADPSSDCYVTANIAFAPPRQVRTGRHVAAAPSASSLRVAPPPFSSSTLPSRKGKKKRRKRRPSRPGTGKDGISHPLSSSSSVSSSPPSRSELLRSLQSLGHTPALVLEHVGSKLSPRTDADGTVSSVVLVRLAKLMLERSNASEEDLWDGKPMLRTLGGVCATLADAIRSGRVGGIEAGVEGIKAAGVLSRLLFPSSTGGGPSTSAAETFGDLTRSYAEVGPGGMAEHHLSGLRWAYDNLGLCLADDLDDDDLLPPRIGAAYDALDLPFRVRPGLLDGVVGLTVPALIEQVDFRADTVRTTSTGKAVRERRLTAWEGDPDSDVPGFAYSGKVMPTRPLSPLVRASRDELRRWTDGEEEYDCCLLNLYTDGQSAMNYHIDPDQDVLWGRRTAVVSVGSARRFAFRDIPDVAAKDGRDSVVHNFVVLQGDVTVMFGDCQWRYQHAVKPADGRNDTSQRSSLVFKQTLASVQRL